MFCARILNRIAIVFGFPLFLLVDHGHLLYSNVLHSYVLTVDWIVSSSLLHWVEALKHIVLTLILLFPGWEIAHVLYVVEELLLIDVGEQLVGIARLFVVPPARPWLHKLL